MGKKSIWMSLKMSLKVKKKWNHRESSVWFEKKNIYESDYSNE